MDASHAIYRFALRRASALVEWEEVTTWTN